VAGRGPVRATSRAKPSAVSPVAALAAPGAASVATRAHTAAR
jgi:hypothetical protein